MQGKTHQDNVKTQCQKTLFSLFVWPNKTRNTLGYYVRLYETKPPSYHVFSLDCCLQLDLARLAVGLALLSTAVPPGKS